MQLFHHAHGQTKGSLAFADELRDAGHTVHAPDLYDGKTFDDLDEGVGYAREVGFDEIMRRGAEAAEELPDELVFAGFSPGRHARAVAGVDTAGRQGGDLLLRRHAGVGVRRSVAEGRAAADPHDGRRPVGQ